MEADRRGPAEAAPLRAVAGRLGTLDRGVALAERRPGGHPALEDEGRLDAEVGWLPQDDVGEASGLERPDVVGQAVGDGRLDGDLGEVAQDALVSSVRSDVRPGPAA